MRTFIENNLQRILNRYLALDPESLQRIHALENEVITLQLTGLDIDIQLQFINGEVIIKTNDFLPPVTVIKGRPFSLLHMSFASDRKKFFGEDVSIEGNIDLGQQVIDLFDHLDIDWEEHLSQFTGDVPAHQVGRFLRGAKNFTKQLRQTLLQNINEFTHEEIPLFPPREAMQDFFNDVDTLRMDTDRLEARVELLSQKIMNQRSGQ